MRRIYRRFWPRAELSWRKAPDRASQSCDCEGTSPGSCQRASSIQVSMRSLPPDERCWKKPGHQVSVHGFLGSMLYSVDGRIKIVQFWHMRVVGRPMREPMDDIKPVKWLPLKQAVEILTRAHEKVFLANVGPVALKAARQSARDKCIKPYLYNNGKRRGPSMRVAPAAH